MKHSYTTHGSTYAIARGRLIRYTDGITVDCCGIAYAGTYAANLERAGRAAGLVAWIDELTWHADNKIS